MQAWMLLAVFVGTTAGLALMYAGFIRLVDPRHHFGTEIFPVLSEDARSEKLRLFRDFAASGPIDGIVLGSSRVMKLAPSQLMARSNARFFNLAVGSARAEDHLAMSRWVQAQGSTVRTVIIGLDLEALHDADPTPMPLEFNAELQAALQGRPVARPSATARLLQYKRAFGASHFVDGLESVALAAGLVHWERSSWFETDGRIRYPIWERQQAQGTYDLDSQIASCESGYVARLAEMRTLSAARRAALQATVVEWRARGTIVKMFITPLHERVEPRVAALTRYRALLGDLQLLLDTLARDTGVLVYDYSRPQAFGGRPGEWYDCYHPDDAGAARIVDALMKSRR
jgi:hypothetical protein